MSFGFGVGDFITLIQVAKEIHQRLLDAPEQFRSVSRGIDTLSSVLEYVQETVSRKDLKEHQKRKVASVSEECGEVLLKLQKTLDGYQELKTDSSGAAGGGKTIGSIVRRTWKKVKWDETTIDGYQRQINLSISAFGLLIGQINLAVSSDTKSGVDRLNEREEAKETQSERKLIIDWLTSGEDYAKRQAAQHDDLFSRFCEGTGQWLLESGEFRTWCDGGNKILFCTGIPGAGKTICTAAVIDHLHTTKIQDSNDDSSNGSSVGIAYFYSHFRRQEQQKPLDIFTALLQQLIEARPTIPAEIKKLHESKKSGRPSLKDVSQALKTVLLEYSTVYILIDGLDEIQVDLDTTMSELLKLKDTNIFVTSRAIPDIETAFKGDARTISLTIRAHDEDIRRYVDSCIKKLPRFVSRKPDLQEQIKADITRAANGMFLLAELTITSLDGSKSPKDIKAALQNLNLPKGSSAYDYAYDGAMERIEAASTRGLAKQALSWVICAKRPLTVEELRHALAVEVDEDLSEEDEVPELDEDNLSDIEDIITACTGLLTIDEESSVVRFVHYTAQEYFERTWRRWLPESKRDVALACVTYLSYTSLSGFCQKEEDFVKRQQQNLLHDYAARYWGAHVQTSSTEGEKIVLNFLTNEAQVAGAAQGVIPKTKVRVGYHQERSVHVFGTTALHLTAFFGLGVATQKLLKMGYHLLVNCKDSIGRTPLSWAAGEGYEAVVEQLCAVKAIDLEWKDSKGRTPLHWVAETGDNAAVERRTAVGASPDSKISDGQTVASSAIARKLILAGADIDAKDTLDQTPLHYAARSGSYAVTNELLAAGAEPNSESQDRSIRRPVEYAVQSGHIEIFKLLLATGVEIDAKKEPWSKLLRSATSSGNFALTKLLLDKGTDPNGYWSGSRRQLFGLSNEAILNLLLDAGADPNLANRDGDTPLMETININVSKLLLARSANVNAKNKDGKTALYWAVYRGDLDMVKLLIAAGADRSIRTVDGTTLLVLAATPDYYERESVLKYLKSLDEAEATN